MAISYAAPRALAGSGCATASTITTRWEYSPASHGTRSTMPRTRATPPSTQCTFPTQTHPAWCDPRSRSAHLAEDGSVSYEHIGAAPTLRPVAMPETELLVYPSQIDDRSQFPSMGAVNVT